MREKKRLKYMHAAHGSLYLTRARKYISVNVNATMTKYIIHDSARYFSKNALFLCFIFVFAMRSAWIGKILRMQLRRIFILSRHLV